MVIIYIIFILTHFFMSSKFYFYNEIVRNRQYFTIIESITPYMAICISRYLICKKNIYNYIASPYILCIGILSLHFYVISNLLIGLLSISKDSSTFFRLFGLIGVLYLTYLFTFWRFKAQFYNSMVLGVSNVVNKNQNGSSVSPCQSN